MLHHRPTTGTILVEVTLQLNSDGIKMSLIGNVVIWIVADLKRAETVRCHGWLAGQVLRIQDRPGYDGSRARPHQEAEVGYKYSIGI